MNELWVCLDASEKNLMNAILKINVFGVFGDLSEFLAPENMFDGIVVDELLLFFSCFSFFFFPFVLVDS